MDETSKLFDAYENIREYLPHNNSQNKKAILLKNTKELTESASCFFLDAFGILNVGTEVIDGAIDFLNQLKKSNIPFLVLSNAASISKLEVYNRFNKMGIFIELDCIVTSREVLFHILQKTKKNWGVIAKPQKLELTFPHIFSNEENFFQCERFLFLSSQVWDDTLQKNLLKKYKEKPFEIWVANPDISAPQEQASLSKEPVFYTLLEPILLQNAHFICKPFP